MGAVCGVGRAPRARGLHHLDFAVVAVRTLSATHPRNHPFADDLVGSLRLRGLSVCRHPQMGAAVLRRLVPHIGAFEPERK